jgi:hypothetical protein
MSGLFQFLRRALYEEKLPFPVGRRPRAVTLLPQSWLVLDGC